VQKAQEQVLGAITKAMYSDAVFGSDLSYRLYKQISGVTAIETQGDTFLGSKQHILIASTQDCFDALQRKLLRQRQG
jgi:hypothetical protein